MTRDIDATTSVARPVPRSVANAVSSPVDQLGDAIAELAARLHAATYELLVLLRQFDEQTGWNTGFLSCAHWLHWRTGIDLGAAREKVRVAKALVSLPRVSAAMQRGALSYAKVRALTRVATPDNEAQLLDLALAGTAAHVERFVRAWRRVDRVAAARDTARRHQSRELSTWVDDDGMVIVRGRLTPELGAVLQRALDAAADQLFRAAATRPPADSVTNNVVSNVAEEITPGQRRADALGLLAEVALSAHLDGGTAGDRYQVVLHVDVDGARTGEGIETGVALGSAGPKQPLTEVPSGEPSEPRGEQRREHSGEPAAGPTTDPGGHAVLEVGDGATYVSAETSRRFACDASVVVMRHRRDGSVLDVARKTRTIPPAIRRALATRDRGCQFPGCTARRCDAHHVVHWAEGGATSLDNLVLLCRRHHTAVHEGGWTVRCAPEDEAAFFRPDGARFDRVPPPPHWDRSDSPLRSAAECGPLAPTSARLVAAGIVIGPYTATPGWDGHPFDVVWAMDVLRGAEFAREPGV